MPAREASVKRIYRAGAGSIVLAAVVILFGSHAIAFVKSGFPPDSIRREALDRCAAADSHFLRYLAKDRVECYRSVHLETETAAILR